ncbi:hypothetical protein F2P81_023417 [Scophthalmus maximus]|uniref:Uncharacterized protein n=1 Tax=Scophthalmus maximus TaxID=52904 RepID=A0A6A4RWR4_SCOMX|nr:hypothetical protein F2P81_023417 [Scophthalmus maximus]
MDSTGKAVSRQAVNFPILGFRLSVCCKHSRSSCIVRLRADEMAARVKNEKGGEEEKREGDAGDESNNERFMTDIESRRRFYQPIINQIAPTEM